MRAPILSGVTALCLIILWDAAVFLLNGPAWVMMVGSIFIGISVGVIVGLLA